MRKRSDKKSDSHIAQVYLYTGAFESKSSIPYLCKKLTICVLHAYVDTSLR